MVYAGRVHQSIKAAKRVCEMPEVGSAFVMPSSGDESLVIGGLSYGASITLYIGAAQRIGAVRSQMLFATSPVWGIVGAVNAASPSEGGASCQSAPPSTPRRRAASRSR